MARQVFGKLNATLNLQQVSEKARLLFNTVCYVAKQENEYKKISVVIQKYFNANISIVEELLNLRFKVVEDEWVNITPVFTELEIKENKAIFYVNKKEYFQEYVSSMITDSDLNVNIPRNPILNLKSKYALRLYELTAKHDYKSFHIDFNDFKNFMCFPCKYKSHTILERLSKAEKELLQNGIIENISHEEIRETGGSIRQGKLLSLCFIVKDFNWDD